MKQILGIEYLEEISIEELIKYIGTLLDLKA